MSKRRDPSVTGRPRLFAGPGDPCPCGSGKQLRACCLTAFGHVYTAPASIKPPAPRTGLAVAGCYLSDSRDCQGKLSREHAVSSDVLEAIIKRMVDVSGLPWIPPG